MKLLFFIVNLVALLATQPSAEPQLALTGLDPVLLVEGEGQPGLEEWTLTYGSFNYRFSSAANLSRFRADPDRFSIQLRGACPVRPDLQGRPEIFLVHKGTIYLFFSEECRSKFEASPDKYLKALPDESAN